MKAHFRSSKPILINNLSNKLIFYKINFHYKFCLLYINHPVWNRSIRGADTFGDVRVPCFTLWWSVVRCPIISLTTSHSPLPSNYRQQRLEDHQLVHPVNVIRGEQKMRELYAVAMSSAVGCGSPSLLVSPVAWFSGGYHTRVLRVAVLLLQFPPTRLPNVGSMSPLLRHASINARYRGNLRKI